jgi:hypothetical protein
MEEEENNSVLDGEWINNFKKNDKLYQDFYLDDIYYTSIHFVYINKENNIEIIKEENFLMSSPNYISREEIIKILKMNTTENNKKYSTLSILKCNITLHPEEIPNFVKSTYLDDYFEKFIKPVRNIDAITFDQTINMFQDLNDLLFIFYEKVQPNNVTKKVYLNNVNGHKKTIKRL